ncbi:MAG: hypothetical protein A2583_08115 [Bdellovibrionales bacterium RIFOXYD1_FULL_53_11]|nr:MAG: hypothetical protein A2583_08115 [Bdellovibrionales bacterium RIFOXYD1_FULL_53_11]
MRAPNTFEYRLLVELSPHSRGLPRSVPAAALARALMLSGVMAPESYLGFPGTALCPDPDAECWVHGADAFRLTLANGAPPAINAAASRLFERWGRITGPAAEDWRPGSYIIESSFKFSPAGYFRSRGLKHTLRKTGDGGAYRLELTHAALKKNIIRDIAYVSNAGRGITITVAAGHKFHPADFVRECFVLPDKNDWVRVSVKSVGG